MTRLKTDDIDAIPSVLEDYDAELKRKTGSNLIGIACHAEGVKAMVIQEILKQFHVGVITFTCGQGVISGFAQAVAGIGKYLGCSAFVADSTDAAGLAEAFAKKADVLLFADDMCFVAWHAVSRSVIDNAIATGKGFAAGLDLMAQGLQDKEVLLVGCGAVGQSAAAALMRHGADLALYDINHRRCFDLEKIAGRGSERRITVVQDLPATLFRYRYIVDASPAENFLGPEQISEEMYLCAPGMPLGLSGAAVDKISERLLHDPLQIGVATMLVAAAKRELRES